MKFQIKHINEILVCEVQAKRATLSLADELRDFLIREIESGTRKIIIDLSKVDFIDSSYLGAIMAAMKRLVSLHGDLKICTQTEQILTLLKITRLNRIFPVYNSIPAAANAFTS